MRKNLLTFLAIILILPVSPVYGEVVSAVPMTGEYRPLRRHPELVVPEKMRPRVEFWRDIYSKYGKHNMVIHHRLYPYIVFEVLDFERESQRMSEGALKKLRLETFRAKQQEIETAMRRLAEGQRPRSALEERVASAMSVLGPGRQKYLDVVKEGWIRSQSGIRERYAEAVERSGRYLHLIEKIFVEEYGLPIELTRLPFVESSFDYTAYSSVGAAGIWQFMPATGRMYQMRVDRIVDERRDVVKASHGAAKYLLDAYRKLGTWPLALTSYNHGMAGVARKVKQLGTRDIAQIIESSNPQLFGVASQNFYASFLAALEIADDLPRFFPGISPLPRLYLVRKPVEATVSADLLARHLGIEKTELQAVNYALLPRVWRGQYKVPRGYTLNIPARYADRVTRLATLSSKTETLASASSVYGGGIYQVRRGDSLSRIAKKFGTSVSSLRSMNNLRNDSIRVGQRLVVSERENTPLESSRAQPSRSVSSRSAPSRSSSGSYVVQRGDTLYGIARRYGMSMSELRELNGLSSSRIRIGQRLEVPARGVSSSGRKSVVVQRGDTLWSLSQKHGASVSELERVNKLRSSKLKIGQRLTLP